MAAKVILQCRPTSHQFTDREICLAEPVKVGRAVANCKPNTDNGFFNCKVLSRNHALLWYEDGKFYLQDTQSSNGTFVNNQKLPAATGPSTGSQSTLKTDPAGETRRELFSGDVIQFGVEVAEQAKKGAQPVTHGCIIASVRLFHPDGSEAKLTTSKFATAPSAPYDGVKREDQVEAPKLTVQEIYELQSILQEAHHREHVLESKVSALNRILLAMERKDSWTAMFQEDLLLSKIQFLQCQLQAYEMQLKTRSIPVHSPVEPKSVIFEGFSAPSTDGSQDIPDGPDMKSFPPAACDTSFPPENLKDTFLVDWKKMLDERSDFEISTKKALHNAYVEKLEAVKALAVAEERLANAQNECDDLNALCEGTRKDLLELVERFELQTQDLEALTRTYQEAERVKLELLGEMKVEKNEVDEQLKDLHLKYTERKTLCDDLVEQNSRLREKLEEARDKQMAMFNHYDRIAGDVIRNNGYSGGSEDEDGVPSEDYVLKEQPLMENIFKGKNVAQLLSEFGGVSHIQRRNDLASAEKNWHGDVAAHVTRDVEFNSTSDYVDPPSYESMTKEIRGGDSFRVKAEPRDGNDVEQLIAANEGLTDIVIKLQTELAQLANERDEWEASKGNASVTNTVEMSTSTDALWAETLFAHGKESPENCLRQRTFAESQLTEVLDELNNTANLAQSVVADGFCRSDIASAWTCRDPGAVVALMLLVLWLIFLMVFA